MTKEQKRIMNIVSVIITALVGLILGSIAVTKNNVQTIFSLTQSAPGNAVTNDAHLAIILGAMAIAFAILAISTAITWIFQIYNGYEDKKLAMIVSTLLSALSLLLGAIALYFNGAILNEVMNLAHSRFGVGAF